MVEMTIIKGLTEDAIKRLAMLNSTIEKRFDAVDQHFERVDTRLDTIDRRPDDWKTCSPKSSHVYQKNPNYLCLMGAKLGAKPLNAHH
jgi:hypothetical protein